MGQCPFLFGVDSEFEISILQKMIELGCDVNSRDSQGESALHYACYLDNKDIEKWLIEQGIPKDVKNDEGLTPYDV